MGLIGLWNVKRRANRAVRKFQFVVNNIRRLVRVWILFKHMKNFREKSGQNRVLRYSERLKKWLSVLYPPWKKEKDDGIYDNLFEDGTRFLELF